MTMAIFLIMRKKKRRLLLHKYEIRNLKRAVSVKGYTIIPTRMYIKKVYVN